MTDASEQPFQKKEGGQNKKKHVQFDNAVSKDTKAAHHWRSTTHGHRLLMTVSTVFIVLQSISLKLKGTRDVA